ncbi:NAD(P)H-dependent oxidoreductase [Orbaceae bacterium ESL0727]|nr:NAD(P)H-dependent oxidoreductase [Orbaceae bacterium ESL0727]
MDKLSQAFNFRHACKQFDEKKKITPDDLNAILEAGRSSPSSFGMEPWHFVVVDNPELKKQLRAICYDQPQVSSCSHFIIVLYRKANQFTGQSNYLRSVVTRGLANKDDQTAIDIACQSFINYCTQEMDSDIAIDHWSEMQCYIASTNMMTAAAYHGIDSCAIGGFQQDRMIQILEKNIPQFSGQSFGIALCLAFGYRVNQPKEHIRWPLKKICTFL